MNTFLKYLFSPLPGMNFKFYNAALIFIGALIVCAIIAKIILKKYKETALRKHFNHIPKHLVLFAALFGFLIFSRYERIVFFSMRFVLYAALMIFFYWVGRQIYVFFAKYKEDNKRIKEIAKMPKYSTKKHK